MYFKAKSQINIMVDYLDNSQMISIKNRKIVLEQPNMEAREMGGKGKG